MAALSPRRSVITVLFFASHRLTFSENDLVIGIDDDPALRRGLDKITISFIILTLYFGDYFQLFVRVHKID